MRNLPAFHRHGIAFRSDEDGWVMIRKTLRCMLHYFTVQHQGCRTPHRALFVFSTSLHALTVSQHLHQSYSHHRRRWRLSLHHQTCFRLCSLTRIALNRCCLHKSRYESCGGLRFFRNPWPFQAATPSSHQSPSLTPPPPPYSPNSARNTLPPPPPLTPRASNSTFTCHT
jgi:hypothetical protein